MQNFRDKIHGANPTILWSGDGYHFLQPLYADVLLEMESVFAEFVEPSRKLMQYAEKLVTDNKGDPCHYNTVSFNNCMIRIPGSYNSKYVQFNDIAKVVNISPESEVKIIQRWDGYRPNIKWLLKDYWIDLIQERNNDVLKTMQDEQKRLRFERKHANNRISNTQQIRRIDWIESLYGKSLDDFTAKFVSLDNSEMQKEGLDLNKEENLDSYLNWNIMQCRQRRSLQFDQSFADDIVRTVVSVRRCRQYN